MKSANTHIRLKENDFTDTHFANFWRMLVCADCWERYDFERYESVARRHEKWNYEDLSDKDLDYTGYKKIYDKITRRTLCTQCIAVAEIATSRKMEMPDPYPVYERTPTTLREAKLLYNHLVTRFDFRESTKPKSSIFSEHRAICVRPGGFTYPFKLGIYYIRGKGEQDQILTVVDEFLKPTGRDQILVTFYESGNWIEGPDGSGRQGEEKVLREELLNF